MMLVVLVLSLIMVLMLMFVKRKFVTIRTIAIYAPLALVGPVIPETPDEPVLPRFRAGKWHPHHQNPTRRPLTPQTHHSQ